MNEPFTFDQIKRLWPSFRIALQQIAGEYQASGEKATAEMIRMALQLADQSSEAKVKK